MEWSDCSESEHADTTFRACGHYSVHGTEEPTFSFQSFVHAANKTVSRWTPISCILCSSVYIYKLVNSLARRLGILRM